MSSQMNLGHWDTAIVRSVFLVSVILPVYALFDMGMLGIWQEFRAVIMLGLLYYCIYLLLSALGWLLIGFPAHWLICRFGGGKLAWYVLIAVVFAAVMYVYFEFAGAATFGLAALLQALLFRYYAYKPVTG